MSTELTIKGTRTIDTMKFTEIEGGFGPNCKSMLAKDIAEIHGQELFNINKNINNNRTRFVDNVDIIDVKNTEFAILLKNSGIMTQNSINAANNIYLLSERGYAKLLKILEDDLAWELYDRLVDEYFNMRVEIREAKTAKRQVPTKLEKEMQQAQIELVKAQREAILIEANGKSEANRKVAESKAMANMAYTIQQDPTLMPEEKKHLLLNLYRQQGVPVSPGGPSNTVKGISNDYDTNNVWKTWYIPTVIADTLGMRYTTNSGPQAKAILALASHLNPIKGIDYLEYTVNIAHVENGITTYVPGEPGRKYSGDFCGRMQVQLVDYYNINGFFPPTLIHVDGGDNNHVMYPNPQNTLNARFQL